MTSYGKSSRNWFDYGTDVSTERWHLTKRGSGKLGSHRGHLRRPAGSRQRDPFLRSRISARIRGIKATPPADHRGDPLNRPTTGRHPFPKVPSARSPTSGVTRDPSETWHTTHQSNLLHVRYKGREVAQVSAGCCLSSFLHAEDTGMGTHL